MRALLWLGLGAAAMYLLDPEQGRRRREEMRSRLAHFRSRSGDAASAPPTLEADEPRETPAGSHHLGR